MFSFKWNGDYSNYSVTFDNGWTRLNSCNAATFKRSDWSSENALREEVKTETFYLVSYATPILYVKRKYYMGSGKIIGTEIYVNEEMWNTSRTTIKHISRFCRNLELFYGIPISYYEIRDAMKSSNLHFGFSVAIKDRMVITRNTPKEIEKVFQNDCPRFW